MSTLDDISGEKQRLAERLSRIDADRARVVEQLAELEAAERVLSRLEQARPGARRRRGSTATAAPQAPEPRQDRRRRRTVPQSAAPSLGDATLRAVAASGGGISADQIRNFLANEFGMQVRPNHLGMALQRHRRAGRLDQRDALWYPHQGTGAEAAA
jgi:hypothetical protein